jgi:hypothetical protein
MHLWLYLSKIGSWGPFPRFFEPKRRFFDLRPMHPRPAPPDRGAIEKKPGYLHIPPPGVVMGQQAKKLGWIARWLDSRLIAKNKLL